MANKSEPYVGPRPFKQEESNFFFGRDQETNELISLITAHPVVLLYAQSGAGKTSLLNANFIPKLETEEEFDVLPPMRVQGQIPADFKVDKKTNIYVLNALACCCKDRITSAKLAGMTLAEFLKQRAPRTNHYGEPSPRVLIFDQFEELFTSYAGRYEDRQDFFEQIRDALEGNPKKQIEGDPLLRVVFAMREDYIAELDPYAHLLPEKLRTRFRLEHLREKPALSAITRPLEGTGRSFAPGEAGQLGVAEQLVKNLLKIPGKNAGDGMKIGRYVEPVQLQVVCQSLWQALGPDESVITHEHLKAYGSVSQALSKFYESSIKSVAQDTGVKEADLRSWFENTLITSDGNRAPIYQGPEATGGMRNDAVKLLEELHLIKAESKGSDTRLYELAHDRFIELIRKSNENWLAAQSRAEQTRLRLEVKAAKWRQGVGGLLAADELFEANRLLRSSNPPSQSLRALMNASQTSAQQKRVRMLTGGVLATLLLLVLMSSLAAYAWQRGNAAIEASNTATTASSAAKEAETKAMEQKKAADDALAEATIQRDAADVAVAAAKKQKKIAEDALTKATEQQKIAEQARNDAILAQRDLAQEKTKVEQEKQRAVDALGGTELARAAEKEQREIALKALDEAKTNLKRAEEQRNRAEGKEKIVRSQLAAIKAGAYIESDPELSVLLAKEAIENIARTEEAEQVFRTALASLSKMRALSPKPEEKKTTHEARVNTAAFSPDGNYIITASDDRRARLWNARGALIKELSGHAGPVKYAAFSPDNEFVATAGLDEIARVWNGRTGDLITELKGHSELISRIAFSPDSKRVATASDDRTARVWEARTGKLIGEPLRGHKSGVSDIAFSSDGIHLATEARDETGRIWNLKTGKYMVLPRLSGPVAAIAFSPDGKWLVTEASRSAAKVWDVTTGWDDDAQKEKEATFTLDGHQGYISAVAFSPDGKFIVTASADGTARVWSASTGKLITELNGHLLSVSSAAFSPDSKLVVTASADNTARVWEAGSGKNVADLRGHGSRVNSAAFSPDGKFILTASEDRTARLWEFNREQNVVPVLSGHLRGVSSAVFDPDVEKRAVVTASSDGTARLWDVRRGTTFRYLTGHMGRVYNAAFSPNGEYVVTASADGVARTWNAGTGKTITELRGHRGPIYKAVFSPDNRFIATTGADRTVRFWDTNTGTPHKVISDLKYEVYSVAYSPDGKSIIAACDDNVARIWKVESGELVKELSGHGGEIYSAEYNRSGDLIVTASEDDTARIWKANTGDSIAILRGHANDVNNAVFSPDGQFIVTASDDKTARVWGTSTGDSIAVLRGHAGAVYTAAFSPDSRLIVTASTDGTARIYPPETFAPLEELLKLLPQRITRNLTREERENLLGGPQSK